MDLLQFIGFVVSMIVLTILSARRSHERRQSTYDEDELEVPVDDREARLKKFLRSLDEEMEEDQKLPPPPPVQKPRKIAAKAAPLQKKKFQPSLEDYHTTSVIESRKLQTRVEERTFQSSIEDHQFKTTIDDRYDLKGGDSPYELKIRERKSSGRDLINRLESPQEMIILQTIIGPPKCLDP
jgi:hypothetical protein